MGLFGVNMPTIYGEGRRAFTRLQHEIMSLFPAYSLLAWSGPEGAHNSVSVEPALAPSTSYFTTELHIVDVPDHHFIRAWNLDDELSGLQKTPYGLRVKLPIFDIPDSVGRGELHAIIVLPCKIVDPVHLRQYTMGLPLVMPDKEDGRYYRAHDSSFVNVESLISMSVVFEVRSITLGIRIKWEKLECGYHRDE